MSRDRSWELANDKRDRLQDCCVVCGKRGAELAHIIGRVHDKQLPVRVGALRVEHWGRKPWIVHPDRVTLLCGPATDEGTCHHAYDSHQLDLLPYLTAEEQTQAVADAGGIVPALTRISPMVVAKPGPLEVPAHDDIRSRIRELP